MTTETRQRIRAYKRMLPDLRERVIAVALLLAMSASMLGSASFAWITLSRAPEISGMSTTVAANGNLEIALAQGKVKDGYEEPLESQIGDSASSEKENWGIADANVTWGNLINLSDPKYGLEKIALRPATLRSKDLHISPLQGASYGEDGRVEEAVTQYKYTSYKMIDAKTYEFAAGDDVSYGVRAISSIRYENLTGNNTLAAFKEDVESAYNAAQTKYKGLVSDDSNATPLREDSDNPTAVETLRDMVSTFANDKLNNGNSSYSNQIWYLYLMMLDLQDVLNLEGEALRQMANWQAYIANNNTNANTFADVQSLIEAYNDGTLSQYGVTLQTMKSFVDDMEMLNDCVSKMKVIAEPCEPSKQNKPTVLWSDFSGIVNKMIDIDTATLRAPDWETGKTLNNISPSNDATSLMKCTSKSNAAEVSIKSGILKNTEQRLIPKDYRMKAAVEIEVTFVIKLGVWGKVSTTAAGDPAYWADFSHTDGLENADLEGDPYAKDTYGMAIDMWLRTNAADSILTLEGTTLYSSVPVTFTQDGVEYQVYTLTVGEETAEVYQKMNDTNWYLCADGTQVDSSLLNGNEPVLKEEVVPSGFQGENRIWKDWEHLIDNQLLAEDATTQGMGSCFVFYADTPSEQSKLMEMMKSFAVVFSNQDGEKIAKARLDTEHAYINQGKITAPLILEEGVEYQDDLGESQYGIIRMNQNLAQWLTAIIYIDGGNLKNENVLATSNIVGQLNLQFGSTAEMSVRNDEELQNEYRTITAEAVSATDAALKSSQSDKPILYTDYDPAGYDIDVNLKVEGKQPERMSAAFVRVINDTQGTRGQSVDFTDDDGNGVWTGRFKLTEPGKYILNSVSVDGLDYRLRDKTNTEPDNHPGVTIEGRSITYANTSHRSGIYRTSQSTYPIGVFAKIDADPALTPKTVWAQFFNENETKQYNAQLTYNPEVDGGRWEGTVYIGSSDVYYLRFLTIDGVPEAVPGVQARLECYTGMFCDVRCIDWQEEYTFKEPFNLKMEVDIYDDTRTLKTDLETVHLYYHVEGSSDDYQGMHASMTWNAEKNCYETELQVTKPGTFVFNRISADGSNLDNARYKPTILVTSPIPPSYVDGTAYAKENQVALNKDNVAEMKLRLSNASNATVWAELEEMVENDDGTYSVKENGRRIPVQNSTSRLVADESAMLLADGDSIENSNVYEFVFKITDSGIWRVKRLYCQGVYNGTTAYPVVSDPNRDKYTGPATSQNSYVIDLPETDVVQTKVTILVQPTALEYAGAQRALNVITNYGGKDAAVAEHAIFYPHKTEKLQITIQDTDGKPIDALQKVTWTVEHSAVGMKQYGGYEGYAYGDMGAIEMTHDGKGNYYVDAEALTLDLAGVYTSKIEATFDVGTDQPVTLTLATPGFTVSSCNPTVAITAIDDPTGEGTFTPTSATVKGKGTKGCLNTNYDRPNVSITLSNMSEYASSAKMDFTGDSTKTYQWSSSGVVTEEFGNGGTNAGTLSCSELQMTMRNGVRATVRFAVSTITIINTETKTS